MRRIRRTTLIAVGCFSVLAGLGAARRVTLDSLDIFVLLLPLIFIFRKSRTIVFLIVIICFCVGLWRGSLYMEKLNDIRSLAAKPVVIDLTATSDAVYGTSSQLEFVGNKVTIESPPQKLAGNFRISGFGVPMVYRGDHVRVKGKLFPTRGASQGRISYAKLEIITPGNQWYSHLTRKFTTGMENALPEPQASFGLGLLIGQRTNLPRDILTQLTVVGLVHIVAVSGYNLTILVRATQRLKINSKYQKTVLSLLLIAAFLLVTGFSASIVRAAVISVLSIWAWYYGRQFRPIVLIAFAAALTAFINPFYVWTDLGWYLSFLAFFGVLIIAPVITARLFSTEPKILTLILIETLCAEVMTLPLIMMVFGQMSLIALLANLLVVPLIPAAMLFSAIAALAGVLTPTAAGWLAWPANLLLTYILDLVHLLSSIPSIFLHLSISINLMIGLYLIILFVLAISYRRSSLKNAIITDKNLMKYEVK
jgi:ComEC/Rec2-related protein